MEYILKNNLQTIIREIELSDAEELVEYIKIVSNESDNLLQDPSEWQLSVSDEKKWIKANKRIKKNLNLVVYHNQKIIAVGSLYGSLLSRIKHRSSMQISVLKAYYNQGIGNKLMELLLDHANKSEIVKIDIELRKDLLPAIHMLEKFGFTKEGEIAYGFKSKSEYIPLVVYGKILKED